MYRDRISGAGDERPELKTALDYVRAGDTLVVWRLDRFGRGLKDLVAKMEELEKWDVQFVSLQENMV